MRRHPTMERLAAARPAALDPDIDHERRQRDLAAAFEQPRDRSASRARSRAVAGRATGRSAVRPAGGWPTSDRSARPGRGRRVAIGLAAGTAAVGIAVSVAVLPGEQTADHQPTPWAEQGLTQLEARDILLVAAEQAAEAPGGKYWRAVGQTGFTFRAGPADRQYSMIAMQETEIWMGATPGTRGVFVARAKGVKPASPEDEAAWKADGSPTSWTDVQIPPSGDNGDSPHVAFVGKAGDEFRAVITSVSPGTDVAGGEDKIVNLGGKRVSYRELQGLPADPAQLRERLLTDYAGVSASGLDPKTQTDQWLFEAGSAIILNLPVSGEVRAAAYRMLADLPGVRKLGEVTDPEGRKGQAVAISRPQGTGGTVEHRLILDADASRALAEEIRFSQVPAELPWLKPDQLWWYTVVSSAGWTDEEPVLPEVATTSEGVAPPEAVSPQSAPGSD